MDNDKIPAEASTTAVTASAHEEQIRKRAYEMYVARDGRQGSAIQDWLQAEAEIMWKLTHQ